MFAVAVCVCVCVRARARACARTRVHVNEIGVGGGGGRRGGREEGVDPLKTACSAQYRDAPELDIY
jgi:hypothetical protein